LGGRLQNCDALSDFVAAPPAIRRLKEPADRIAGMAARILVVEDDPDIAALVTRYLDKAGFVSERVASGRDALTAISSRLPDLLVLDLMLPHVDGLEVCRVVRGNESTAGLPIIAPTSRSVSSAWSSAPTTTSPSRSARTSSSRACVPCSAVPNALPGRARGRSPTARSRSTPTGTSSRSTAAMWR
jgi:CheY-like chemotaxis protein